MLLEFAVENFLSFKEEVTFSMLATQGDKKSKQLIPSSRKNTSILRLAAIYGPNASGKSNLIKALSFAKRLILKGTRGDDPIQTLPFRLDEEMLNKPSRFEFVIEQEKTIYHYGFKVDAEKVCEEWLFARPKNREVKVFERISNENQEVKVDLGKFLTDSDSEGFLNYVSRGTRPNQLFLTEAVERNVSKLKPINEWFKNVLTIIDAESRNPALHIAAHENRDFNDFLAQSLASFDTGIFGVGTKEEVVDDISKHFPDMPDEVRQDLQNSSKNQISLIISDRVHYNLLRKKDGQLKIVTLKTKHQNKQGYEVDFDLTDESEGTQRMIYLIPILYFLRANRANNVFFIDELDRRLHPSLCRAFLQNILALFTENNSSQVIFTTHDVNLLDADDLLRRDEVWFTEKDLHGVSKLYSLAEFKVRPDLRLQKSYLNGRFGAIPVISNFQV